ncbi:flagellar motor stator protein MotA [Phenylobacterium sp.]|uniref:flagellar motor stator protein MotA n=1 Tax=Phenylobacterium sp. TaxID=1871053 RepID=UPI00374DF1AB
MFQIIGIVLLFGLVFGSFIMTGGNMGVVLEAAPHELMCIGGAGLGAMLISNSVPVLKGLGGGIGKVFKGPSWKAADYRDLLSLLFTLTKTMKSKGVIALESHIETPHDSAIFSRYPKIMKDHFAIDFICDTLRMMTMNLEDPHQVEDAMEAQLEKHHHEALEPPHALTSLADALPALGIVAAVLGVIKTMGAITEPPAVLGGMIGSALVGTFMGVFLAYGMVGPMATRMAAVIEEDASFYKIIQAVLVAHLHGNAAQISVEIGRGSVPSGNQPSFLELEEALSAIPAEGAA